GLWWRAAAALDDALAAVTNRSAVGPGTFAGDEATPRTGHVGRSRRQVLPSASEILIGTHDRAVASDQAQRANQWQPAIRGTQRNHLYILLLITATPQEQPNQRQPPQVENPGGWASGLAPRCDIHRQALSRVADLILAATAGARRLRGSQR